MDRNVLAHLEPKNVYRFFEELCRLPHESHNTKAASDWAEAFAKERNLKYRRDEVGNVIIRKDATPGYEDHPAVMIQGHLDMVCVKDNGVEHDFTRDPLDLYIEDGFVKARGTSLGGDDGIAVAMAMAICDDDSNIPHPPLECVFTVDEEVGMLGAEALDCSDLNSRYLLNIDSETEGILTAGCAGGTRCRMDAELMVSSQSGTFVTLDIDHLSGGHSGTAIHMGFANAAKLMGELLHELGCPRLVSLTSGQQDNAIPTRATAVVMVDADKVNAITEAANAWAAAAKAKWTNDPGFTFTVSAAEGTANVHCPVCSKKAAAFLAAVPNGVQAMNPDLPDQVQTSLNLGVLRLADGKMSMTFLVRSSDAAEQAALTEKLQGIATQFGAAFAIENSYPPWQYRRESRLRDVMVDVFTRRYGKAPVVELVHAGLECGLLMKKIPDLDAVSFGPDLMEIHSSRERMSIESTERVWNFLLGVLAAL